MHNTATRVKGGVRLEFAGGTVVILTLKDTEKLAYAMLNAAVAPAPKEGGNA